MASGASVVDLFCAEHSRLQDMRSFGALTCHMLAFKLRASSLRIQCALSPRIARQEAVSSWIPSCDTPRPFCECKYSLPPAATDRLIGLRGLRRYAIVLTILRSQDPGAFADQMHDVLRSSSRAALAEDQTSTRFTYLRSRLISGDCVGTSTISADPVHTTSCQAGSNPIVRVAGCGYSGYLEVDCGAVGTALGSSAGSVTVSTLVSGADF